MAGVGSLAELMERDPVAAARDAAALASEAAGHGDWLTAGRAHAVRGRALRLLGEFELAERALREALDAAAHHGVEEVAADAHLALAGALSATGRPDEAFEHLDDAARLGSEETRERATLQRAVILRDIGRFEEADEIFTAALPGLRERDRTLDLARVLANRGGIFAMQGRIEQARADLEEAAQRYLDAGLEFPAYQAMHDLGCAVAAGGRLREALDLFDRAAAGMAVLGHDASEPLESRAQALLGAGLVTDARHFATEAARRSEAAGDALVAGASYLLLAEASRLAGDLDAAVAAADRAAVAFADAGDSVLPLTVELERARIRRDRHEALPDECRVLDAAAAAFTTAGDVRSAIAAHRLAALANLDVRDVVAAARHEASMAALMETSPTAEGRVALHQVRGCLRLADGDLARTGVELRLAFGALAEARRLYGDVDTSAALGGDARDVASLALRVARAEHDPLAGLVWVERARDIGRPVLSGQAPPTGFVALRAVAAELKRHERAGLPAGELRQHHVAAELALRSGWLGQGERPDVTDGRDRAELAQALAGAPPVVSIAVDRDAVWATVVAGGTATTVDLGPAADLLGAADRAEQACRAVAGGRQPSDTVAASRRRRLDASLDELDRILRPAFDALDLLEPGLAADRPLVMVVPPALVATPWAGLACLSGRAFTLAPSVWAWVDAAARPAASVGSVLAVAGPSLAEAEAEACSVAACYPRALLLTGGEATVDATLAAIGEVQVAHLAAHGTFRSDNPMWSTVELADGPITVYELQALGAVPDVVVVATCESAASAGGSQLHGLAATLMALGVRTVVASIGALPDTLRTRERMVALHTGIACGRSPAAILAELRCGAPAVDVVDASLLVLGVG